MTRFPLHIRILSDDTEVEFVREIAGQKEPTAEYRYIKSSPLNSLLGSTFWMSAEQIRRLHSSHNIEIK